MNEPERVVPQHDVALVELLDRALGAGVVIVGDVTLSLADIDLVELSLRLVLGSVPTLRGTDAGSARETLAAVPARRLEEGAPARVPTRRLDEDAP